MVGPEERLSISLSAIGDFLVNLVIPGKPYQKKLPKHVKSISAINFSPTVTYSDLLSSGVSSNSANYHGSSY